MHQPTMERIKRNTRIFTIASFIILMSLPGLTHFLGVFDQGYYEKVELREPVKKPSLIRSLGDPGAYVRQMNRYLEDHFGFRFHLIRINNTIKYLMGLSASNGVIIGKNGWIYCNFDRILHHYAGSDRFSDSELDAFIGFMEQTSAGLEEKNIPFYLVIPPNKLTVYPEYLPDYVTKLPGSTKLEQLEKAAGRFATLSFLSLRPQLLAAKNQYPLYYQTDSHWNSHGAYEGYRHIMQMLKKDFPNLTVLGADAVGLQFEKNYNRDLVRMLNLAVPVPDLNGDRLTLKNRSRITGITKLDPPREKPKIVKTGLKDLPSALIFCDSYTIPMEPLFNESFKSVIYVKHDKMKFDPSWVERYQPDMVLYIAVERMLAYTPRNEALRSASSLYITDWGPKNVVRGVKFLEQPNGQSAMWVKVENATKACAITWDGHLLNSSLQPEKGVLTALVPQFLYNRAKRCEIVIQNQKTDETSNRVYITVSDH